MTDLPGVHKPLTPMATKFVEGLCTGLSPKEAALQAGAAPSQAGIVARRYLRTNPVKIAIDAYNASKMSTLQEKAKYDVAAAMAEFDVAMAFALRTNNAAAYIRAVELKSKLHGLLEKDSGAEANNFQINITGLAAPGAPKPVVSIFD